MTMCPNTIRKSTIIYQVTCIPSRFADYLLNSCAWIIVHRHREKDLVKGFPMIPTLTYILSFAKIWGTAHLYCTCVLHVLNAQQHHQDHLRNKKLDQWKWEGGIWLFEPSWKQDKRRFHWGLGEAVNPAFLQRCPQWSRAWPRLQRHAKPIAAANWSDDDMWYWDDWIEDWIDG